MGSVNKLQRQKKGPWSLGGKRKVKEAPVGKKRGKRKGKGADMLPGERAALGPES